MNSVVWLDYKDLGGDVSTVGGKGASLVDFSKIDESTQIDPGIEESYTSTSHLTIEGNDTSILSRNGQIEASDNKKGADQSEEGDDQDPP